jgi:predicted phage-related endonuclease
MQNADHQPAERPDPSTYIGGSDAPVLMGYGYGGKSATDLWMEMTGKKEMPVVDNEPARWGLLLEPFVGNEFASKMQVELAPGVFTQHSEFQWVGGHPDYTFLSSQSNRNRNLECKTSMARNYKDGLPMGTYWQCQHYNFINGAEGCDVYVACLDTREFMHYRVEANLDDFQNMLSVYDEFWYYVKADKPPPAKTAHDLEIFHTEPNNVSVEANARQLQWVNDLEEIRLKLKPLEEHKKLLEEQIKFSMGDAQTLVIDDQTTCTWKPVSSSRFDAKAFQRAHPELHQQFKTQTTSRRFSINHSKRK